MADTIALMRKRVLDMAIRGELVDQLPEEESANTLIEEIILEKKRRKKGVNISMVPDAEKPFDLPKNWRWIKFGDLVHFQIGKTPARGNRTFWDNGTYPWVSIADMSNGKILNNTKETVSEEAKDIVFKGGISPRGTLIMSFKLTIGKLAILDMDAFHNEAIISIYPNHGESDTIRDYLFYIINALDLLRDTKAAIKGATLNKTSLNEILVPLPPLAEQKRIVAKIEEIFAVIDQIGTKKEEALGIIKNMRQTALQDAIMGVLVEQDETDEPASELYEKIKNEKEKLVKEKKIKKEKPLPEIEENETPFDIPESWKWVRFNNILDIRDGTHDTPKYHKEGIPLITSKNLRSGDIDFTNIKYISEEDHRKISERSKVDNGDILFAMIGTIGNPVLVNTEAEFSIKNVALFKNYPDKNVETKYILYFLKAIEKQLKEEASGAVQSFLSLTYLRKLLIPLPPIAEQYRIIEKLDEIMSIFDQMEAILDGTSETSNVLGVAE
ncbi:restriction endonuclease subunit S [Aerococcus viridans]